MFYLVFSSDSYYPLSGIDDLLGSYEEENDAYAVFTKEVARRRASNDAGRVIIAKVDSRGVSYVEDEQVS